jgi:hypothetical protein
MVCLPPRVLPSTCSRLHMWEVHISQSITCSRSISLTKHGVIATLCRGWKQLHVGCHCWQQLTLFPPNHDRHGHVNQSTYNTLVSPTSSMEVAFLGAMSCCPLALHMFGPGFKGVPQHQSTRCQCVGHGNQQPNVGYLIKVQFTTGLV